MENKEILLFGGIALGTILILEWRKNKRKNRKRTSNEYGPMPGTRSRLFEPFPNYLSDEEVTRRWKTYQQLCEDTSVQMTIEEALAMGYTHRKEDGSIAERPLPMERQLDSPECQWLMELERENNKRGINQPVYELAVLNAAGTEINASVEKGIKWPCWNSDTKQWCWCTSSSMHCKARGVKIGD